MVLVKQSIEAELTGNWELHPTIEKMLQFFHGADRYNYAASGKFYIQDKRQLLKKINVQESRQFVMNVFFTLLQYDKHWSDICSDMTIEKTLMRRMKCTGGITRGRRITDSTLSKWTFGMPILQQVLGEIEEFLQNDFPTILLVTNILDWFL